MVEHTEVPASRYFANEQDLSFGLWKQLLDETENGAIFDELDAAQQQRINDQISHLERKNLDVILINSYQFIGIADDRKRDADFPNASATNYKRFLKQLANLVTLGSCDVRSLRAVTLCWIMTL